MVRNGYDADDIDDDKSNENSTSSDSFMILSCFSF